MLVYFIGHDFFFQKTPTMADFRFLRTHFFLVHLVDSRWSLEKYLCLSPGVSCVQGWAQQASVDQLISQMVDQFKSSGQLAALETASDQQKAAICRCDTKYKISNTVSILCNSSFISVISNLITIIYSAAASRPALALWRLSCPMARWTSIRSCPSLLWQQDMCSRQL